EAQRAQNPTRDVLRFLRLLWRWHSLLGSIPARHAAFSPLPGQRQRPRQPSPPRRLPSSRESTLALFVHARSFPATLSWSLNLFRIRGIPLSVHASFFLLLAWIAHEGWQLDGWNGLFWSTGTLLAFFTCVVLHELGHSFTALHYGIGVRRILLMPIGGM